MGDLLGFAHVLFGKPVHTFPEHALILAIADRDGAACGLDRLLGELNIRDLLDRRLPVLLDVAILGAVVDRPLRARGIETGIDRPDAIFGQHVDGIFDRFSRFVRRFFDDRHDFRLVAEHGAIGLDHGGGGIAQERAVARDPVERGTVGVEHVIGHEIGELNENVQARLLFLGEIDVLGMQGNAVDLPGEQARQAAGGGGGDELRVVDGEAGGAQDFAAHAPVEAADPAAGRAELLALEIGRGLHVG